MRLTHVLGSGIGVVVICISSALADGGGGAPRPTAIVNPHWLRQPTADDAARFYPAGAGFTGGTAEMQCLVTARGTLDGCEVISESPEGEGFGAAALAMAPMFMMRPRTINGQPTGGAMIRIPIIFAAGRPAPGSITVARSLAWEQTPTAVQFAAAFPDRARGDVSAGRVVLRCQVRHDRTLTSCDVASEQPRGKGFGEAARGLAKAFKVAANDRSLRSVRDLYVDLPFDFQNQKEALAPTEIYDATWLKGPDPRMAGEIFPAAAVKAGYRTGVGVVQCTVRHDGGLRACAVVAEDPPAMGFGEVALAAAGVMVMNPWTNQGFPVDGATVRVPIRLNLNPSQASALPESPAAPDAPPGAITGDGARTCSGRTAADVNAASKAGKILSAESCGFSHNANASRSGDKICAGQLGGAHTVSADEKAAACEALIHSGMLNAAQMAGAYIGLSDANAGRKDNIDAIADTNSAVAWDPRSYDAWAHSCNTYNWAAHDLERAKHDCTEALKLEPDSADALTFRGDVYLKQRNYDLAIRDYDQAIRLKPGWMWPWTDRGAAEMRSGKLSDAKRDLDMAVQLSPDWATGYVSRGEVEILQKDLGRAASDFASGLTVNPKCAGCLYGQGLVKLFEGDASGSADLARGQQLDPDVARDFADDGLSPPT